MLSIKKKTYKAPKWFVTIKKEAENEMDKFLKEYSRSAFWWENSKTIARKEFVDTLNDDERVELSMIADFARLSNDYAFARWVLEKRGKVVRPEVLEYDREKEIIKVEWGLINKMKEVFGGIMEMTRGGEQTNE